MAEFPNPEHDHGACTDRVVRAAQAICRRRGARLTSQRETVLGLLARSHRPMGAYEILDAMAASGKRPAPITIYRALDFLVQQGLAHRIESRNAFVACMVGEETTGQGHGDTGHDTVVFLICRDCDNVGEALATGVGAAIDKVAKASGFAPDLSVVEIDGLCSHCAGADTAPAQKAPVQ